MSAPPSPDNSALPVQPLWIVAVAVLVLVLLFAFLPEPRLQQAVTLIVGLAWPVVVFLIVWLFNPTSVRRFAILLSGASEKCRLSSSLRNLSVAAILHYRARSHPKAPLHLMSRRMRAVSRYNFRQMSGRS